MIKRVSLAIAMCVSLLITINGTANCHPKSQRLNNSKKKSVGPRYIIIENEVNDNDPQNAFRTIEVLFDERAFSEENLRKLFQHLSRRNPKPEWLKIHVYTSLEQIGTPEETDQPLVSEKEDDPEQDKYHWAFFMREDGNEWFRYNTNPPDTKLKMVVLKKRSSYNPEK